MDDRKIRALLDRRTRLQAKVRGIDEAIERWQRAQLRATGLSREQPRVTVIKMFTNAARVNMSSAKANGDPLTEAANAAGYSLRRLADEVKRRLAKQEITCSQSLISQARSGERSIRQPIANAIQKLTGFPATPANWPGGIVDK